MGLGSISKRLGNRLGYFWLVLEQKRSFAPYSEITTMKGNDLSLDAMFDDVEEESKEIAVNNPGLAARVHAQNSKNIIYIFIDTYEINELPCAAIFSGIRSDIE